MTKQTLLLSPFILSSLLLFSGCAERGYQLTSQTTTNTVTAESSIDIADKSISTSGELRKMQEAVKKERKRKVSINASDTITEQKTREANTLKEKKRRAEALKRYEDQKEAKFLEQQQIMQENAREAQAEKEKMLKAVREQETQAIKEKQLETLKKQNKATEAKALEAQMAKDKLALEAKRLEELEKEKALEAKKLTDTQKALALKKDAELREAQALEQQALEEERLAKAKILQAKRAEELKLEKAKKAASTKASTEELEFQLINKIYHKFGNSEVHGHVIYLDPSGQETTLTQSKVYLLPISAKLNHWYENYYLTNTSSTENKSIVANYLNSTYLNLEKNFEFYGVAEGSYYVIIESNYPSYIAKNKKVYIAKKIKVGQHKKIMAVFSKKL